MATMLSIKDVCVRYGLSKVYVQRMVQKGVIPTTRVEIAKNTFKHMISEEDAEVWRKTAGARVKREDGRGKYTMYATNEEIADLENLLQDAGLEVIVQRTNKVKVTEN